MTKNKTSKKAAVETTDLNKVAAATVIGCIGALAPKGVTGLDLRAFSFSAGRQMTAEDLQQRVLDIMRGQMGGVCGLGGAIAGSGDNQY